MLAALETLGLLGPRARQLAARIDLTRSTGLRQTAARTREYPLLAALETGRSELYRELWAEAAHEVGAELRGLAGEELELRAGSQSTRVVQQQVALDPADRLALALDKDAVAVLMRESGLPVPESQRVFWRDLDRAGAFLDACEGSCVVKPRSGTGGGVGVTAGVGTRAQLRRALLRAARSGDEALVERQAGGEVYRLLFLDGELLDTLRRLPPRLSGDGHSTIGALVRAENRRRAAARGRGGVDLLTVDLDFLFTIERAGLRLGSVPRAGETVTVKTVTNENRPADNEPYPNASPDLVGDARRAVEAVGLRLGGVDVVTPDPKQGLAAAGGVLLEVNGTPGLHHHYLVADPAAATRVAIPILEALLR